MNTDLPEPEEPTTQTLWLPSPSFSNGDQNVT
jgi:hypothetical protein